VIVARFWKMLRPKMRVAHWCFDLYPEAAFADGLLPENGLPARILRACLKSAYDACDLIVDIGSCMRRKLDAYRPHSRRATLVPWALEEPREALDLPAGEREALFGNAKLGLIYSGNFGRAHSHQPILALARRLRPEGVHLAFSVRGNSVQVLRDALTPEDTNVSFASFAAPEQLAARLACADIHVVSLREEWTGTVVPSKFFGALAAGRPVLFCGSPDCAIADWIRKDSLGWVLTPENVDDVAQSLTRIMNAPEEMKEMRSRCHRVYQERFARDIIVKQWGQELRKLVDPAA
jgi:glycosyltransferase involved in cell wall biosynthesis